MVRILLRHRLAVLCVTLLLTLAGLKFLAAQERERVTNPNFTGTVYTVKENSQGSFAHYRFEAGAHTKWHTHEGGQIVLCEEGVCRTQMRGGPVIELHANEAAYCPPGGTHWHGAAPGEGGTQFNVSRGKLTWLEEVSDAEYQAAPRK